MSTDESWNRLLSLPIISSALNRLRSDLPPNLYYHVASHTDDVMREVILFSTEDNLPVRERDLLSIGAAYHDLGFVVQLQDNERIGAEFAKQAMLKDGNYTSQEIDTVFAMIADTQVQKTPEGPRQVASTKLSGYLLDADVSNLGRDDFFEKAESVRMELGLPDDDGFLSSLWTFLLAHSWNTPAAKRLRQAGKTRNIELLRSKLAER